MLVVWIGDRAGSATAKELGEALAFAEHNLGKELEGIVNYSGAPLKLDAPPEVLNAFSRTDKLAQLTRLQLEGVKTVPFSLEPKEGWLGRTLHHQQGRDFTRRSLRENPDYWTEKLNLTEEWRLHVFRTKKGNLRVLRSGKKVPNRPGHHPWIRSHRLGWKLSYIGGAPAAALVEARNALNALQLDFGAVDLGVLPDGSVHVLEVNTCPGLEGGTLGKYVENIMERLA